MKTLVTYLLLLIVFSATGQNKTYKFYYDKVNSMNAEYKFKYLLEYSNSKSTFRSLNENRKFATFGKITAKIFTVENGKMIPETDTAILKSIEIQLKHTEDSLKEANSPKLLNKIITTNKPFIIKDLGGSNYYFIFSNLKFYKDTNYVTTPLENFNWALINETKTIANKICKKATCTWMDRNYTAWYCPAIPISDGPYKFTGLPGIILEISDDELFTHYICTAIETQNENLNIILPTITTSLATMKLNANKALLKAEELNRSQNELNNNSVLGKMESSSFNIYLVERTWIKNKFKD